MNKFIKYAIGAAVVVGGIIAAGLLLYWGDDNDIEILKNARDGLGG